MRCKLDLSSVVYVGVLAMQNGVGFLDWPSCRQEKALVVEVAEGSGGSMRYVAILAVVQWQHRVQTHANLCSHLVAPDIRFQAPTHKNMLPWSASTAEQYTCKRPKNEQLR